MCVNVAIPAEVVDLDSFCRWATSKQRPERGQFSYLRGAIWVDLSLENIYRHNQVKAEFHTVLGALVTSHALGWFIPNGMMLHNSAADLSTEPDAMLVSYDALRSGRVQRIKEPACSDCLQLDGSPETTDPLGDPLYTLNVRT
jgi:hypothetical protein